jgi:cytochrome b561
LTARDREGIARNQRCLGRRDNLRNNSAIAINCQPRSPWLAPVQRRLHWWTAVLVLLGCAIGWLMVFVPFRLLLAKFVLYQLHQTVGIIVFALIAARLFLRPRPVRLEHDEGMAPWRRQAASGVRAMLYLLLAATPILGYLTAATAPDQIPTFFLGLIRVPNIVGEDLAWFPTLKQLHRAFANLLVLLGSGDALAAVYFRVAATGLLARKSARQQRELARPLAADPATLPGRPGPDS